MISTILQTAQYVGIDGTAGDGKISLTVPSTVTMQAVLTGVFSGGAPVSASAYIDYYIANGKQEKPSRGTPFASATGVTEVQLALELQGGNAVAAALLVFVYT